MDSYTVIRETWLSRKLNASAVTTAAIATLALLVGSLMYWGGSWGADQWMSASPQQVFGQHQFWRAWTTVFVHADPRHLLSNSLLFFIMGVFLSGYFGHFVFPLLALFMGGLTNLLVLQSMRPQTELIGASGVVFWMGGFWLVLYFLIDRRRTLWSRALRSFGVALALFMPAEAFDPSISYQCHLYGFVLGSLAGCVYFVFRRREFRAAEFHEVIWEDGEVNPPLSFAVGGEE